MRDLLHRLGDPHLQYPVIHVAGTKGKGSVTKMVGEILTAAGVKTGVYMSPHLETIHQRMSIDGSWISDEQLLSVLNEIQPVLDEMDDEAKRDDRRDLTFFEVTTAATFYHFAKEKVKAAVIEVGLGGRLDSTNVCDPSICVITNISFDHTKQLGNTLEAIAGEKAGIIKPGIPVVSGAINPDASKVIERVAADNEAPLYLLDRDFRVDFDEESEVSGDCSLLRKNRFSTRGKVGGEEYDLGGLELQLLGTHQATNGSLAVAVAQLLNQRKVHSIEDSAIREGIHSARLVGRTEVIRKKPLVIADMAHNVASVAALIDALTSQIVSWKSASKRRMIIATSREKDTLGMMRLLIRHFDEVIVTKYQNNPRGKEPEELMEIAVRLRNQMNLATEIRLQPTPEQAWESIQGDLSADEIVCVTGSAFLVAELRSKIMA